MVDGIVGGGQGGIPTYDYRDLEDGRGVVTYNGYKAISSGPTVTYHLGKEAPYSDSSNLSIVIGGIVGVPTSVDIDTGTFATPRVLNGTMIINFCVAVMRTPAGAATLTPSIKVYHVDASSTETQVGSTWTGVGLTSAGGGDHQHRTYLAQISCPRKKFKRGEKLRIEFTGTATTNDFSDVEVGIDPQNRDVGTYLTPSTDATLTSQFIVLAPYEIGDV